MQKTKKRHTFEINMGRIEKLEAKNTDSNPPSDDGFYQSVYKLFILLC